MLLTSSARRGGSLFWQSPSNRRLPTCPGTGAPSQLDRPTENSQANKVLLAAAAAVSRVPQQVHRESAHRPRGQSAADRTERGAGGLPADVITGPHRHGSGLVHGCSPITGPRAASSSVDIVISRAPRLAGP